MAVDDLSRAATRVAARLTRLLVPVVVVPVVVVPVVVVPFVVVPFGVSPAAAAFVADATGVSSGSAQTLPGSAAPVAVAVGRDVTVTWAPVTMSGGTPATGYVVRRFDTGGVAQTVLADCAAVSAPTCVERGVPAGTWRYTVQPVVGGWVGPQSTPGAAITVLPATLTITSPMPITAVPATVDATLVGGVAGETIEYRLDDPSGPVLTGSPGVVTSGSQPVTVTLSAGLDDGPHSVVVVGSSGTLAAAAIDLVMPPVLTALTMHDADLDGRVDEVRAGFDQPLAPSVAAGVWTLNDAPSGATVLAANVSGSTVTLVLQEGTGPATTEVGGFTVALAPSTSGVRDVHGHPASFPATAPADRAAPAPVSLIAQDANGNGRIDRVAAVFSETLAPVTSPAGLFGLANVPSGGVLAGVSVTSPSVTLTIAEGVGPPDTSVGAFTVTLSASAAGIRDAAGNVASFTRTPMDGAAPVRRSMSMFDDDLDGRVDRVTIVATEPLAPFGGATGRFTLASVPSSGSLAGVAIGGDVVDLVLAEGTSTPSTSVGAFTVGLAAGPGGVTDPAGLPLSFASAAPADRAAPAPRSVVLQDADRDGRVDRVSITWSETLATDAAGTAPWSLTSVPSGGLLTSVAASGTTTTLSLAEGSGALDTSVGATTVALAASTNGIRDVAGNLTSFLPRTPSDGARPLLVGTITDTNGALDGRFESGDTLSLTFSEPLAPSSVPATVTVTLTDPTTSNVDRLAIPGVLNGSRSLGGSSYLTADGTVTFAGSPVSWSNGGRTLTVALGPTCTGSCASLGQQTTPANVSMRAAATITDPSGNAATGATRTTSIRLC
jgi:hypothetical protein